MNIEELKEKWNAQADAANQWDSLGLDEIVDFLHAQYQALPKVAEKQAEMTLEKQIDAALDSVLRASGSALKYYTMPKVLDEMRAAMRKVMSDSYCDGSNDMFNALQGDEVGMRNSGND